LAVNFSFQANTLNISNYHIVHTLCEGFKISFMAEVLIYVTLGLAQLPYNRVTNDYG
jgi:hypothetical protein